MLSCTLCGSNQIQKVKLERDADRYFFCEHCYLIFVHPVFRLTREAEKSRYENHNNGIDQPGYVKFLYQCIEPALQFLKRGMTGLDYGCGPSPTLSKLLIREGFECFDYDPIFNFEHPLKNYDFIFATECLEHFYRPGEELYQIKLLLNAEGYLSIMTEQWSSIEQFETWYYKNDPTHVSFFHQKTFEYISRAMNFEIVYQNSNRVIIFKNNN